MTGYQSKKKATLDKLAQPVQDPVAFCNPSDPISAEAFSWPGTERNPSHTTPLCTPPAAQRPWVGLTADEYAELAEEYGPFPINQIEAKLKEKNT